MSLRKLQLEQITVDQCLQIRVAGLHFHVVSDYVDAMKDGAVFPPVEVFYDGATYWLADGFHRVEAYRRRGVVEVEAHVQDGTERDALLYAVAANLRHGLRVTRADKRNAVRLLLLDPEMGGWSKREIGKRCGVDGKTVDSVRKEHGIPEPATRKMMRGGKVLEIDTTNIGARETTVATAETPQTESTSSSTEGQQPGSHVVELTAKDQQRAAKIAADYGWSLDDAHVFVQCQLSKRQQDAQRRQERRDELERLRKRVARKIKTDLPEQKRTRLQNQLQVVTELARQYNVHTSVVLAVLQQDAIKKR